MTMSLPIVFIILTSDLIRKGILGIIGLFKHVLVLFFIENNRT